MSRRNNPEIKIVYPDASQAAMLLTEAMIKRSSGKRVVETNSEEKEYTGQELFAGALACKTDTSVELTLRLNPDAMDYALTTLIAKNLTEDERRAIRMETTSMEVMDLLTPAQAAEASGQALDGDSSADVPSAEQEAATQSGEQEEKIEIKLADSWVPQKIAAVLQAAGCSKKSKTLDPFARGLIADLEKTNKEDEYYISLSVLVALVKTMAESKGNDPFALYSVFGGETETASWDEIEREARKIGQHKTDKTDKTDEDAVDQEIEPGLLNDLDDRSDGMAPAEEVMGHDE